MNSDLLSMTLIQEFKMPNYEESLDEIVKTFLAA